MTLFIKGGIDIDKPIRVLENILVFPIPGLSEHFIDQPYVGRAVHVIDLPELCKGTHKHGLHKILQP